MYQYKSLSIREIEKKITLTNGTVFKLSIARHLIPLTSPHLTFFFGDISRQMRTKTIHKVYKT